MSRTEVPFAEVLAAVRDRACAGESPAEVGWTLLHAVAQAQDMETPLTQPDRRDGSWQRFTVQVRRALNCLAGTGELVKVRLSSPRRMTLWYPPEAYRSLEAARLREQARQRAERDLWARLYDELAAEGFTSSEPRGRPVVLSAGDWAVVTRIIGTSREGKPS
jgi:hypothetical protein